MLLLKLNPIEPPWYGPVCPVVWEGRRREVSPIPIPAPKRPDAPARPVLSPGDRLYSPSLMRPEAVVNPAALVLSPKSGCTGRPPDHWTGASATCWDREFADSPLEEGVSSELVSEPKFPGNRQKYRDFHRPSLRIPTSSSESRAKFSHLRPNSLRLGTGKLFWSIRELNRVIRELIRLISELRDLTVISIYINRVPASF